MEKEYKELKFHVFKTSQLQHQEVGLEFSGIDGVLCLECKDNCPGFIQHQWRRSCNNCRCPVWKHDIPPSFVEHPFKRMCIEEKIPPLVSEYEKAGTDGYEWYPRGLLEAQLTIYMKKFPVEKIPKSDTEGANYRARQIIFQLPKQDFNIQYANFLNDNKSKTSFDELKKRQFKDAIGIGAVRGAVSSTFLCSTCSSTIKSGDPVIFGDRFGKQFAWHPQCFKCCVDGENLVDLIYFCWERKLYCGRHWNEQFKPRCAGCEELVYVGEYTKTMGKAWHIHHFCCWECDTILTGSKYIIINQHPFCQKCYDTVIANTCFACSKPIEPERKDLFVKQRHYHDSCLICSKCKSSLENQAFSFTNDTPICHKCRGLDTNKIRNCFSCSKPFDMEERKVGVNNEYFHENCFLCSQCQQPIGFTKFVRKSDGRKLCTECFKATAKMCKKCNGFIQGSTVRFEGDSYHAECFICTNCEKYLGSIQFYKWQRSPYCQDCYLNTYAKRCTECQEPVECNTKFVDYEKKFWHSKCFCCFTCKKQLAGCKFIVRNGKRCCMTCKENPVA